MHHATEVTAEPNPWMSRRAEQEALPGRFLGDAATAVEHVMAYAHEANRITEVLVLHRVSALLRAAAAEAAVAGG